MGIPLDEADLIQGNEIFMELDLFLLRLFQEGKITLEDGQAIISIYGKIIEWDSTNYTRTNESK